MIDYYPAMLKEFQEIKVISSTEQQEVDYLWDAHQKALGDQFVTTASKNGMKRWERILGIVPKATTPMEDRRFHILARLSEELPYSMGMLRKQIEMLCGKDGYSIELKNDRYTLIVRVALSVRNNYEDVNKMLCRIVPANMIIDLSLLYNQHKIFACLSHGQLKRYTHYSMRNEVINNAKQH